MAGRIARLIERLLDRGAVIGAAIASRLDGYGMGFGGRHGEDRRRRGKGRRSQCGRCEQHRDHAASDHVRLLFPFFWMRHG